MKPGPPDDTAAGGGHSRFGKCLYAVLWVLCRTLGVSLFGIRSRFAEPLPVHALIDGETAEVCDRDRVLRQTLALCFGQVLELHRSRGQRVVATNDLLAGRERDEGAADARLLVLAGKLLEERIERLVAT